jgi:hypothetical protein
MKKILITITLLLFLVLSKTQAQNSIGIKAGISIPNLTAGGSEQNPINSGYSSRLGPDFSVFYNAGVSKVFSLVTQLEYSSQGGKKDGFQAFTTPPEYAQYFPPNQVPPYLYADYKSQAKMNYLMLSELGKLNWQLGKSHYSFYIEAGPFGGYLISAHQVTSGTSDVYADEQKQMKLTAQTGAASFDNKQDIKDDLHKGNFGVEGDVGFALNFSSGSLFIEGGGNYGFMNIQKGSENGKNHIGAATIRLGYACNFGKKHSNKSHS